ncbi:hypothetical protein Chor_009599 [Crotalus horridus]
MYSLPSKGHSRDAQKAVALTAVVTPLLNPIIYTLRNEKVKDAFRDCKKILKENLNPSQKNSLENTEQRTKQTRPLTDDHPKVSFLGPLVSPSSCTPYEKDSCDVFSSAIFMYSLPSKGHSRDAQKAVAVLTAVVTPLLNPFIYTLRNEKVKDGVEWSEVE